MTHIDDRIRSALEQEDRELFDKLDSDQGLQELVTSTFQGKMRWMSIVGMIYILAFTVLGVWCAFQFAGASETKPLLIWAGATAACLVFVTVLKLWFFMEMQKNTILREIKRVELQILQITK